MHQIIEMVQQNQANVIVKSKFFTQCIATIGAMMVMLQTGIMSGWTSPNIARLTSANSTIQLSLSETSWVVSIMNLGRFVSVIILPILIEMAGSKKTIFYTFVPVSVAWLLIILAKSAMWLYVARFLSGITYGLGFGCFSIFLGEISIPAYRGTVISLAMSGWPLGTLIGTVGETYLPMATSSGIYLAQCLAAILLFIWLPESPYHLVKIKQMNEAKKSIVWYRGENNVETELEEIVRFVESNARRTFTAKMQLFKSDAIKKALVLVIMLFGFQQMSGLFNVLFYMEIILKKSKSFLVQPHEFVIYANLVLLVSTIIAVNLIDKLGRRILLLTSSFAMAISMTGLGLHFYLLDYTQVDPRGIQWLPVVSIVFLTVTFTIGLMSVPSTVLSEIFPAAIKSTAACITSFTAAIFGFITAKAYQPSVDAIGEAYVFWIHAAFTALVVPIAFFLLPETKGKSFQEIQDNLHKK